MKSSKKYDYNLLPDIIGDEYYEYTKEEIEEISKYIRESKLKRPLTEEDKEFIKKLMKEK